MNSRLKEENNELKDRLKLYREIIINLKKENDSLKEYAVIDELTKLYNRKIYNQNSKSYSHAVLGDIDFFKHINDTYGHDIGDQVLFEIASIMKSTLKRGDICIRFGGDEFLILFNNCSDEYVNNKVIEIENKINNTTKFEFPISMSFGISKREGNEILKDILVRADKVMYSRKRERRLIREGNILRRKL